MAYMQYMTFISDIITELFTYLPTYLRLGCEGVGEKANTGGLSNEGEGMNICTHRWVWVRANIYLPTYLLAWKKISVIISLKNVMDSILDLTYSCYKKLRTHIYLWKIIDTKKMFVHTSIFTDFFFSILSMSFLSAKKIINDKLHWRTVVISSNQSSIDLPWIVSNWFISTI